MVSELEYVEAQKGVFKCKSFEVLLVLIISQDKECKRKSIGERVYEGWNSRCVWRPRTVTTAM